MRFISSFVIGEGDPRIVRRVNGSPRVLSYVGEHFFLAQVGQGMRNPFSDQVEFRPYSIYQRFHSSFKAFDLEYFEIPLVKTVKNFDHSCAHG
jgi:hypothetical protein